MTTTLKAKLKNGVFLPSQPVDWPEGEEVIITRQSETAPIALPTVLPDPERAKRIVAEIIAMPLEGTGEKFSGTDHDRILYGGPQGAR